MYFFSQLDLSFFFKLEILDTSSQEVVLMTNDDVEIVQIYGVCVTHPGFC